MRKPRTHKWYSYMRWNLDGKPVTVMTQLYQVGLYCVVEAGIFRDQRSTTPSALGKNQRKMVKEFETNPKITDLELGVEKEAYKDEKGLWHEYNKETYGKEKTQG